MANPNNQEKRIIEMDGNLAVIKRVTTEREVQTEDFLSEMTKNRPLDMGFIPRGCIWCSRTNDNKNVPVNLYILELTPHMRKITYRRKPTSSKEEANPDSCLVNLDVSWPHTLWAIRMRGIAVLDVHCIAIKDPVRMYREQTKLYILPMGNQYQNGSGHFCIGTLNLDAKLPIDEQVERLMEYLLASVWNQDLKPVYDNTGINSLEDWAEKSKADPKFYEKIDYRPHGFRDFRSLTHHLVTNFEVRN
jgi:hypothetical protein